MEVSVIIPVGNDTEGLTRTLQSICAQQWDPARVEVIVCNDGGGEAISDLIARFGCIEARLELNRGSYAARNAGIRIARGAALAFLDADETVSGDWLASGLEALRSAHYVGGRIVVEPGPHPSFWERVDAAYAFPVAYYLQNRSYAPTANLFIQRSVVERVGGFNEALRSGGDREFGLRVAGNGFVQRYCAAAVAFHPARNFREQIRKARRTSRGNATLEVRLWRRNAFLTGVRAFAFSQANLVRAAFRCLQHPFYRSASGGGQPPLLAAARAFIDACYFGMLGLALWKAGILRQEIHSRIPAFPAAR